MRKRYGKKNGDGPTAGKKARFYTVPMPDGTNVRKRSFCSVSGPAYAGIYCQNDKWYVAGIYASALNVPNSQIAVEVTPQ